MPRDRSNPLVLSLRKGNLKFFRWLMVVNGKQFRDPHLATCQQPLSIRAVTDIRLQQPATREFCSMAHAAIVDGRPLRNPGGVNIVVTRDHHNILSRRIKRDRRDDLTTLIEGVFPSAGFDIPGPYLTIPTAGYCRLPSSIHC